MRDNNEVNEPSNIVVFDPKFPITEASLSDIHARRVLLSKFIYSQMRDRIDFGVIPGTQNPTLYKPGAEKLAKLFGLGSRIVHREVKVDLEKNFAMASYTVEVYHLQTGTVVSQLEGTCNSQEKKYKERKIYDRQTRKETGVEPTPVGDILNTIGKMAQKRAYVGAIIQATGASDFYTQDVDDPSDAENLGLPQSRAPAQRAAANVPKATSSKSSNMVTDATCDKCSEPMMTSLYPNKETGEFDWYCKKCKLSVPKAG